uniref:Uncharacterized protein n=1 Tax=Moorena producens (strain JHB) TaxID=1454205 RepID=A0A1D9FTU4_MOOP1
MLGGNMGLTRDLLKEVVWWSCAPSRVSDYKDSDYLDQPSLAKIKQFDFGKQCYHAVYHPMMTKILATLPH